MSSSLQLGKIFGIPLGINYSWFIIFAIVTISLVLVYFPGIYPHWSPFQSWVVGIITSLLFFASVVAHELSHSVVATAAGIPVRSITLFLFGGVSQISREATRPVSELVMAVAGPASSLALAVFFGAVWFVTRGFSEPLAALAYWLGIINASLAVFNLVPGFPLDGGRVLRAILWGVTGNYKRATRIASLSGQGIAYLLIFGGVLRTFAWGDLGGLWFVLIGWFLDNAASSSYRQVVLREALQGYKAGELMTQDCPSVAGDLTLGELVRRHIFLTGRRCFLVSDDGGLGGIITLLDVKKVPQEQWDATTVSQAVLPVDKLHLARHDEDAVTVLERMDEQDINQMPVIKEGEVAGMIGRDSLLRFIRMRSELRM